MRTRHEHRAVPLEIIPSKSDNDSQDADSVYLLISYWTDREPVESVLTATNHAVGNKEQV